MVYLVVRRKLFAEEEAIETVMTPSITSPALAAGNCSLRKKRLRRIRRVPSTPTRGGRKLFAEEEAIETDRHDGPSGAEADEAGNCSLRKKRLRLSVITGCAAPRPRAGNCSLRKKRLRPSRRGRVSNIIRQPETVR